MDQQQVNQREWQDASNWSGPKWLSLYFSKRDSRVWVPKQIPAMGWTLNLGHPKGAAFLVIIIVSAILFVVGVNVLVHALQR